MLSMILKLLPLVVKYLPLIIAALAGLGKALEKAKPSPDIEIDEESLSQLIEKLTEEKVLEIVNAHKRDIKVWVPSLEEEEREERLEDLLKQLEQDHAEYEAEKRAKAAKQITR